MTSATLSTPQIISPLLKFLKRVIIRVKKPWMSSSMKWLKSSHLNAIAGVDDDVSSLS